MELSRPRGSAWIGWPKVHPVLQRRTSSKLTRPVGGSAGDGVYSYRTSDGSIVLQDVKANLTTVLVDGDLVRDVSCAPLSDERRSVLTLRTVRLAVRSSIGLVSKSQPTSSTSCSILLTPRCALRLRNPLVAASSVPSHSNGATPPTPTSGSTRSKQARRFLFDPSRTLLTPPSPTSLRRTITSPTFTPTIFTSSKDPRTLETDVQRLGSRLTEARRRSTVFPIGFMRRR
jgi:hypothetical protein